MALHQTNSGDDSDIQLKGQDSLFQALSCSGRAKLRMEREK